jgi:hypothetical protein
MPYDLEEQIIDIAKNIGEELDDADYETKRFFLDRLNLKVVCHLEG